MAGLLPFYLMRQWTNDGKLASGGSLTFYQSGTTTPKAVYQDAALTIPHTNPVTLDASGSAVIFLGSGAYRVLLKDAAGAQVAPPVDGIIGQEGTAGNTASIGVLGVYNDVRALVEFPDAVVVCGSYSVGDGGQGIFSRVPGSSLTDDGGVILTAASGAVVYRRETGGVIDPQWYGVRYGLAIDQTAALLKAVGGSVQHNLPVQVSGSVFLEQVITIPESAAMAFTDDGYLVGGSADVSVTFLDGAKVVADGIAFGTRIVPSIGKRCMDSVRLSNMGGQTDDERLVKLLGCSSDPGQVLEIDQSASVLADSFASPCILRFRDGAVLTFTGAGPLSLSFPRLVPPDILAISTTVASPSFDFGGQAIRPEAFGAVGDGVTDDDAAFALATWSRWVEIRAGHTYRLATTHTRAPEYALIGEGIVSLTQFSNLNGTTLTLEGVTIAADLPEAPWFTGTNLLAHNVTFPKTFTASGTTVINGCAYSDDSRFPVLDGSVGPALYRAHLPLLPNGQFLGTDEEGKIFRHGSRTNYCRSWAMCSAGLLIEVLNVKYCNGKFIAVGKNSKIAWSTTGNVWNVISIPTGSSNIDFRDVCWTGEEYVVVGGLGSPASIADRLYCCVSSPDLVSWDYGHWTIQPSMTISNLDFRAIASNFGDGSDEIVIVSGNPQIGIVHGGPNGNALTSVHNDLFTGMPPVALNCVAYGYGQFAVGWEGQGYTHSSGASWSRTWTDVSLASYVSPRPGFSVNAVRGICTAFGNWILVGSADAGGLLPLLGYSNDITDADAFILVPAEWLVGPVSRVAAIMDTLVAGTEWGCILTSNGAERWTRRPSPFDPVSHPSNVSISGGTPIIGVAWNQEDYQEDGIIGLMSVSSIQLRLETD